MRMDSSQELSAWDVVNGYSERELAQDIERIRRRVQGSENSPFDYS